MAVETRETVEGGETRGLVPARARPGERQRRGWPPIASGCVLRFGSGFWSGRRPNHAVELAGVQADRFIDAVAGSASRPLTVTWSELGDGRLEDVRECRLAHLYQLVGGLADRVAAMDEPL